MQSRFASGVAVGIAAALITGCSGGQDGGQPPNSTAAPSTVANADPQATINVGMTLEPTGLDIFTTAGAALEQVEIGNVYEGLVRRTHDGRLEPLLASEWQISDDALRYVFTLRPDVKFSDGQILHADDVVDSLSEPCGAACGAPADKASDRMSAVQSITAEGSDKVVITLARRDWRLLDSLSSDIGLVRPKRHDVDLAKQTNGTGPYEITNWQQGSSITLTRRDDYWGAKPVNKTVIFRFYKDRAAAANALASGEIDLHTDPSAEMIDRFSRDQNFNVVEGSSGSWMVLGFNHQLPQLADVRVRQAIRMAIDKDGLIKALDLRATRVGSLSVPDDPWYTDTTGIYPPDKAKAKELLAAAGADNLQLTLEVANIYDSRLSQYVAAQLKEIGITVEIKQMEFATWLDKVYSKKDYQLTMVLHVEPWSIVNYANPHYYWNYDSPAVQETFAAAISAQTADEGYAGLQKMTVLMAEEVASDWLYAPNAVTIATKKVAGYPTARTHSQYFVSQIAKS